MQYVFDSIQNSISHIILPLYEIFDLTTFLKMRYTSSKTVKYGKMMLVRFQIESEANFNFIINCSIEIIIYDKRKNRN